jgi:hypothetical protein
MSDNAEQNPTEADLIEQIEKGLCQRAIGMVIETIEVIQEGDKKRTKIIRKQLPPDVHAAKLILTNCCPDRWRSKPPPTEPEEKIIRIYPINPDSPKKDP